MRILISNDDGVYAPGIKALATELSKIADVTVVAPLEERSTTGHTLSLDNPLRVVQIDENKYGCSGYPADCTLIGFAEVMKDNPPDLIVSGINRGANLGQDIYYSGTIAAAREAAFHGFPSIAVSTVLDFNDSKNKGLEYYESAAKAVRKCIEEGIVDYIPKMFLVNINVPNIPYSEILSFESSVLGFRKYSENIQKRYDFRERPYYWIGGIYKGHSQEEGTDCHVVESNKVSLSLLNLLGSSSDKEGKWSEFINKLK
tara:strand:- start:31589 stop:32362 length:774 start_codon:yes stop_codon:yes gene_type:complete